MTKLTIEGTYNVRDLGGIPTQDGRTIKPKTLIRAGNLDNLSDEAQTYLLDYGVATVIDLRDEWEAHDYPNVFQQSVKVAYHNLPLVGDTIQDDAWKAQTANFTELQEWYRHYVDNCTDQVSAMLNTIAHAKTGIMFHCYAGKDRTGIIAALLLSALGVSDEAIATDYSLSRAEINHLFEDWLAYAIAKERDIAQIEKDAASDPETILTMLAHLREQYDSIEKYLKHIGISSETIQLLQRKFVD